MFRTVPLSIIRSFSLYTQQRYMSYSFGDGLRAEVRGIRPAKNLVSSRFFWTGYERSRQWYSPFTACCLHYIPPGWTFRKSAFCPHTVFVCFVWIWEQTAIISLYSINWLVFITEAVCLLRGTDYFLLERKLMIFYNSEDMDSNSTTKNLIIAHQSGEQFHQLLSHLSQYMDCVSTL